MSHSKTAQRQPPHISLFTDHENKSVEVLVVGPNGNLNLAFYAEDTTIAIHDPDLGSQRCKAVCSLSTNGHLSGWFVAKKGATPSENTLVWFPARKRRKRPVKAKR
jgi:hypothetical protein